MEYRMLVLDIDGTLRPHGLPRVPREVADAVNAVQRAGVSVVIGTGRGRAGVPRQMLRGIRPDYWICAAGAQILDAAGTELARTPMRSEEMYALVDFFENYELPLAFSFRDGSYAYVDYETLRQHVIEAMETDEGLHDGEDQDHHLIEMPFSAYGEISRQQAARFDEKYGYLGLRFLYYSADRCDILRAGQDKAAGLAELLRRTGLTASQVAAVGDGENDCALLKAAGLGVCVAGGSKAAQAAADRSCPSAEENGVAALCRELWPKAFSDEAAR